MTTTLNNPKSLQIPSLPELDTLSSGAVTALLTGNGAVARIGCANWSADFPEVPEAYVWLAHTGSCLYALFSVAAGELRAMAVNDLEPVASDTCFELFLKPASAPLYCNFEFNYQGIANVSRRPGRQGAVKFTPDLLARISRTPLCPAPQHDNRPADPAVPVRLLVKIPLDLIGLDLSVSFPAALEGNIYCCSDKATRPYFLSWAPISTPAPDFHRPDFFAPITLL